MRDCETLREDVKAYLDGELPLIQRVSLRLHLARCASCREEMEAMEQIGNELRAGEVGGLEPALRAKLLQNIPDDLPEVPSDAEPKPIPKWRRKPMLLWGATAMAALAWVTFQATGTLRRQSTASEANAVGQAAQMYTQDYDEHFGRQAKSEVAASAPAHIWRTPDSPFTPPADARQEMMKNMQQRKAEMAGKTAKDGYQMKWPARQAPAMIGGYPGLGRGGQAQVLLDKLTVIAGNVPDVKFERQVHKEGSITVEVDSPEQKSENVEEMVKTVGGYVANNEVSTEEDGTKTASMTVKIPVGEFDGFLSKVGKLGNIKAKSVNGEDITEKISDSGHAKRALTDELHDAEAKLREARTRAQRREDQETVRDLRVRVAQEQGRLEMLGKMATLATVSVELREKPKPAVVQPQGGFIEDMKETGRTAVQSFTQAARIPILLLVWFAAYAPIWILLALAYRYLIRT